MTALPDFHAIATPGAQDNRLNGLMSTVTTASAPLGRLAPSSDQRHASFPFSENRLDELRTSSSSATVRPTQSIKRALSVQWRPSSSNLSHQSSRTDGRSSAGSAVHRPSHPDQWGKRFWVVIADPESGHEFFYNPALGEARWRVPAGTPVLPIDPEGQWLEFIEEKTSRSYYYHSSSRTTQWDEPKGIIIPVSALQDNLGGFNNNEPLQKPLESTSRRPLSMSMSAPSSPSRGGTPATLDQMQRSCLASEGGVVCRPKSSGNVDSTTQMIQQSDSLTSPSGSDPACGRSRRLERPPLRSTGFICQLQSVTERSLANLSLVTAEAATREEEARPTAEEPPSLKAKAPKKVRVVSIGSLLKIPRPPEGSPNLSPGFFAEDGEPGVGSSTSGSALSLPSLSIALAQGSKSGTPKVNRERRFSIGRQRSQNYLRHLFGLKGSSSVPQRTPESAQREACPPFAQNRSSKSPFLAKPEPYPLHHFLLFAITYFDGRHRGLFNRSSDPLEGLLWQEGSSTTLPFMPLDKELHRLADFTFLVVLHACGEVTRPVFTPKPPAVAIGFSVKSGASGTCTTVKNVASHSFPPLLHGQLRKSKNLQQPNTDGKGTTVWEEKKWLLEVGLCNPSLRDEIFCQLITRLNERAPILSRRSAWRFLSIVMMNFLPAQGELLKAYGEFIRATVRLCTEDETIRTLARHAERTMRARLRRGGSGDSDVLFAVPSVEEIQFDWQWTSASTKFGLPLPRQDEGNAGLPTMLPFLFDCLVRAGGLQTQGIFRDSGEPTILAHFKSRLEQGCLECDDLLRDQDPHRAALPLAGLIWRFVDQLQEPLVPQILYTECLTIAAADDVGRLVTLLSNMDGMPAGNLRTLLFLVAALQSFCQADVARSTMIDGHELGRIFGPIVLRCPVLEARVLKANTALEQHFFYLLLHRVDWAHVDVDFDPNDHLPEPLKRSGEEDQRRLLLRGVKRVGAGEEATDHRDEQQAAGI